MSTSLSFKLVLVGSAYILMKPGPQEGGRRRLRLRIVFHSINW